MLVLRLHWHIGKYLRWKLKVRSLIDTSSSAVVWNLSHYKVWGFRSFEIGLCRKQTCLTSCGVQTLCPVVIVIIIYLSWSWATCWPVPVSRIQKYLQRCTMIPSASWGVVFYYPYYFYYHFEALYLHGVTSCSCIPVVCPKWVLFLTPLQIVHLFCNLSKYTLLFFSCISSLLLLFF